MAIQAGVGMSHHRNPKVAGQEAVQKALEAAGIEKPDFVFMFATDGYNQQALLDTVNELTGGASLCGCSGAGVIAMGEADESKFSVGIMVVRSDQIRFSNGFVTGLNDNSVQAGRGLATAIQSEICSDTLALFVFPEIRGGDFERLAATLEEQLHLAQFLPLIGGLSGSTISGEISTHPVLYQYANDRVVSDGMAYALLSGQARIAWTVHHCCVPVGIRHTVTHCKGNHIYEIDGKSVMEFLNSYVTDSETHVGTLFSLGLDSPEYLRDYDKYLIRVIDKENDTTTGSVYLRMATEVSEGTHVSVMRKDVEKLARSVEQAAEEIKIQLEDNPAGLVFQFDCKARGKMSLDEQQKLRHLETLQREIGIDVPWLGFYCFGEIAPVGGHNCFHNYTVALAAIY